MGGEPEEAGYRVNQTLTSSFLSLKLLAIGNRLLKNSETVKKLNNGKHFDT